MKKLLLNLFIRSNLRSCSRCHGMGVIEKPNGDTIECPVCKGKGYL